jgi:hypothetical protein
MVLVTDFMNLKITQSFGCGHMDQVYMCVFIGSNAHTYICIYIYTVFYKK